MDVEELERRFWYLAGFCMRGQHCPEIVGPDAYRVLAQWRFDLTAKLVWEGEGGR